MRLTSTVCLVLCPVVEQFGRELVRQRQQQQHATSLVRTTTSVRRQDGRPSRRLPAALALRPRVSVRQRTVVRHRYLRGRWPWRRAALLDVQRQRTDGQRNRVLRHHRPFTAPASQHGPVLSLSVCLSVCLRFNGHFPGRPGLAGTRIVFILHFVGAKDDAGGGDNWNEVIQSSGKIVTTNKPPPSFLQARCASCRPTNHVRALNGETWYDAHSLKFLELDSSNMLTC